VLEKGTLKVTSTPTFGLLILTARRRYLRLLVAIYTTNFLKDTIQQPTRLREITS